MARRLIILLLILSTTLGSAVYAADPGDSVLFTGEDELSVTILKEAGNRVLTEASTVSERPPALVATTENIALAGEQAIDQPTPEDEFEEPTLTSNSRVLVHRQTDPTENGVYVTSDSAWTRAVDADHTDELVNNFVIYVQSGVVYGQTSFRLTTTGTITLGTTPIDFIPFPSARVVPLSQLPVDPVAGTSYLVSEHDGTCQAAGVVTQRCEWDGDSWEPLGGGGGSTLDAACAAGTDCAVTNLTAARPFIRAGPAGLTGTFLRDYFESGNPIEECLDPTTGVFCQPAYQRLYPDQEQCLVMAILDDPPTEVCLESVQNIGVGGIGTSLVWSDRGTFANRPADPYDDQTYLVTNCLTAACTAGGGTTRVWQQWTGVAWVNLTGTAAAGDIEAVWGCSSADCSTLTAASGDTLDAGLATSSKPAKRGTTNPSTCAEGDLIQDTDAGGSELYVCTATNVPTKLQAVLPWEIPFSAAGLVVDGTNCVQQANTQVNSGMFTRPIVCALAAGTLELSFLSSTRWDGTALTVSFVVADTATSGHVWSANVEAMCRTPGTDTINNTWGTAVAATVTMTTANIPYLATAVVTPNTACTGGDFVAIRATINSATTHTDASARVLGGRIQGSQL